MWEAKVIADVDADAAAETNWKHKVTPDWGDLMSMKMQANMTHMQHHPG